MFYLFLMTHPFTILPFIWLSLWDPGLKGNLNASKSVTPSEFTSIPKIKKDQTLLLFLGVTAMAEVKPAPSRATQGSAVGTGSKQAGGCWQRGCAGVHRLANQILFNLCRRTASTAAARGAWTPVWDFYSLRWDFKFRFPGELIQWISVSHMRLSNCSLILHWSTKKTYTTVPVILGGADISTDACKIIRAHSQSS